MSKNLACVLIRFFKCDFIVDTLFVQWPGRSSSISPSLSAVLLLTPPDTEDTESEMEKDEPNVSLHTDPCDVPGIKWVYYD